MPVPHFLCIGAQKAGTTWLYQMLRQHPDLFLPPIKELHYFDDIFIPEHRSWIRRSYEREVERLRTRPPHAEYIAELMSHARRSATWYRAAFAHPRAEGKVCGEITPAYAILPPEGIECVRATNPDIRIIYVLRDPVQRAVSHLKMHAARSGRDRVGEDALANDHLMEAVLARSAYASNIPRWELLMPGAEFIFIAYRKLSEQPTLVLRQLERFLCIGSHDYEEATRRVHVTAKISVDRIVIGELERRLDVDRAYLETRFGADFK